MAEARPSKGSCCKEPCATRECHAAGRLCQDQEGLPTEQQQSFHSKLPSFPLFKHTCTAYKQCKSIVKEFLLN